MTGSLATNGLVTLVDGAARLVGACCDACATHTFPFQATCPRCGASMSEVPLPATGTVWSWTVQRIRPKPPYDGPEPFEPFAVGYVDLGPLRVESRLEGKPSDTWQIGDAVRFVAGPPDGDGDVRSYRFVSAGSAS